MKLLNGDCIEIMENMIDENITADLILTDPPYGIGYSRHVKGHRFEDQIQNDKTYDLTYEAIQLIGKLIKPTGACYIFGQDTTLPEQYKAIEDAGLRFKNLLVWDKGNWSGGDLIGSYGKKTEFIAYVAKGRHILNPIGDIKRHHNILEFSRVVGKKQIHQNQKPVGLLEFLIKKSSNPNDTVLDPFMGVGSTGVACLKTGRNFIGIELEKNYYDLAKQRLNGEIKERW